MIRLIQWSCGRIDQRIMACELVRVEQLWGVKRRLKTWGTRWHDTSYCKGNLPEDMWLRYDIVRRYLDCLHLSYNSRYVTSWEVIILINFRESWLEVCQIRRSPADQSGGDLLINQVTCWLIRRSPADQSGGHLLRSPADQYCLAFSLALDFKTKFRIIDSLCVCTVL